MEKRRAAPFIEFRGRSQFSPISATSDAFFSIYKMHGRAFVADFDLGADGIQTSYIRAPVYSFIRQECPLEFYINTHVSVRINIPAKVMSARISRALRP